MCSVLRTTYSVKSAFMVMLLQVKGELGGSPKPLQIECRVIWVYVPTIAITPLMK